MYVQVQMIERFAADKKFKESSQEVVAPHQPGPPSPRVSAGARAVRVLGLRCGHRQPRDARGSL